MMSGSVFWVDKIERDGRETRKEFDVVSQCWVLVGECTVPFECESPTGKQKSDDRTLHTCWNTYLTFFLSDSLIILRVWSTLSFEYPITTSVSNVDSKMASRSFLEVLRSDRASFRPAVVPRAVIC